LKALSDTQLAALLGVPPDASRRDVFRDQSYRDPVHARLSPARAAYAQLHNPKELVGRKKFWTRPLKTELPRDSRPTRPSPLHQVCSADYSESPPAST
jgi:hypothetical protein